MCDVVEYRWRGSVTDDEMVELVESYGGPEQLDGGTASARTVSAG